MGGRWDINHCATGVRVGQEENGYKASIVFSLIRPTNWFEKYILATWVACFLILTKSYTIYNQLDFSRPLCSPYRSALTNEIMLNQSLEFVIN